MGPDGSLDAEGCRPPHQHLPTTELFCSSVCSVSGVSFTRPDNNLIAANWTRVQGEKPSYPGQEFWDSSLELLPPTPLCYEWMFVYSQTPPGLFIMSTGQSLQRLEFNQSEASRPVLQTHQLQGTFGGNVSSLFCTLDFCTRSLFLLHHHNIYVNSYGLIKT